uniref:Bet1 golgi vesicular membrane trafficking protein like n=1 Tax=Ornithorhynchus anatinus TaxID=9258 RepID=F6T2L2_ORNAN
NERWWRSRSTGGRGRAVPEFGVAGARSWAMSPLPQDTDFMSVTGLLTGSVKRFSTMTRSGRDNRKLLCYVSAGLIFVFFILYYLVSRART